jgi:hypothetical protein
MLQLCTLLACRNASNEFVLPAMVHSYTGYGWSVAAQALALLLTQAKQATPFAQLHILAILLYGLRLVSFIGWREGLESYKEARSQMHTPSNSKASVSIVFHITCALLYSLLMLPSVYTLRNAAAVQTVLPQVLLAVTYGALAIEVRLHTFPIACLFTSYSSQTRLVRILAIDVRLRSCSLPCLLRRCFV